MAALGQDYQPLTDMRATSDYRLQTARNLLYRFYLESSGETATRIGTEVV
jgi:xanthine dehydrogenase small subunit